MLSVVFYLACSGLFLTISLLGPIGVALLTGEMQLALRFGFYFLIGCFIFGALVLSIIGRRSRIPRMERLLLMTVLWMGLPVFAAIPIMDISELGLIDSLFEAVSGITTSGSTVLSTVEAWPQSLLFWRVQIQWIGGFLALLTVILIMAPMGMGGLTVQKSAFTVGADIRTNRDRLGGFILNLAAIYFSMTLLCFVGLFLTGTRAFYAVSLAMSAVSTGGFLPFDDSLDTIVRTPGIFVLAVFLIAGATSIFWHRMLLKGQVTALAMHRESYSVVALVSLIAIFFAMAAIVVSGASADRNLLGVIPAFMNAASLVSTTGIQSQPGYFTLLPLVLVLFVVLAGGGLYSTSGGIKHFRIGGMLIRSWNELDRLIYPSAIKPFRLGAERFDITLMKPVWAFFSLAMLTLAIGTTVIASTGVPFEEAITVTTTNFATAGPVYNAGWGNAAGKAWLAYQDYSALAKLTLMAMMLLGRVEIIAVVAIFSLRYWRNR